MSTSLYAKAFAQGRQLLLQSLVSLDQVLDGLVSAMPALELFELPFESLDMFLCSGANGALCFTVIGTLSGQLRGCQG